MKRFITIALILAFVIYGEKVYADPEKVSNSEISCYDIFKFDDFDSTSAFFDINLDNSPEEGYTTSIDPQDVISYAKQFLGRPYVWGGKGPNVFDCSGFTSYVYRNFNIILSPCATYQIHEGRVVDDIQPGDLLYFRGQNPNNPAIGHVALAISYDKETGDCTFIHAAGTSVRIENWNKWTYYKIRFAGARRVI